MERLFQPGRGTWQADPSPPPYIARAPNKNGLTILSASGHDLMSGPEYARGDWPGGVRARSLSSSGREHLGA